MRKASITAGTLAGALALLYAGPVHAATSDSATTSASAGSEPVTMSIVTTDYIASMPQAQANALAAQPAVVSSGTLTALDDIGEPVSTQQVTLGDVSSYPSEASTPIDPSAPLIDTPLDSAADLYDASASLSTASQDAAFAAGEQAVAPASVASGHVLWGNRKQSNWIYVSDKMHNERLVCEDGTCVATDDIEVWFKEYLNGGSSNLWNITFFRQRHTGTHGYTSPWWLDCAVNIAHDPDQYCSKVRGGADAGTKGDNFASGSDHWRNFGSVNTGKRYPILTLSTHYDDVASTARGKFRGWDVCLNVTELCSATGTGL